MHYAVIGGDAFTEIFSMFKALNPPAVCLFNPPVKPELVHAAPYLVKIESEEVKNWFAAHKEPWGLYLITQAETSLIDLRKHLRHYTYAMTPVNTTPVQLRFYDPRFFWDLVNVLDDQALNAFLGPIEIVLSTYQGKNIMEDFKARRAPFGKRYARKKGNYFTLNEAEYGALNKVSEKRYLNRLSTHMKSYIDPAIIEKMNNTPDKIHQQMLEHERDVKGAAITNPVDQALLAKAPDKVEENGIFRRIPKTDKWTKIVGEVVTEVKHNALIWALFNHGKSPISEYAFHQATGGGFSHLDIHSTPPIMDERPKPFFQRQENGWIHLAHEEAHSGDFVSEEYNAVLERNYQKTQQIKIYEADFHRRTDNRFQAKPKEDEIDIPETMEVLDKQIDQFAEDFYRFGKAQGIIDERSQMCLAKLFIINNVYSFKTIPKHWLDQLYKNPQSGSYRAGKLYLSIINEMTDHPKEINNAGN